jgi:hypothetical protein
MTQAAATKANTNTCTGGQQEEVASRWVEQALSTMLPGMHVLDAQKATIRASCNEPQRLLPTILHHRMVLFCCVTCYAVEGLQTTQLSFTPKNKRKVAA